MIGTNCFSILWPDWCRILYIRGLIKLWKRCASWVRHSGLRNVVSSTLTFTDDVNFVEPFVPSNCLHAWLAACTICTYFIYLLTKNFIPIRFLSAILLLQWDERKLQIWTFIVYILYLVVYLCVYVCVCVCVSDWLMFGCHLCLVKFGCEVGKFGRFWMYCMQCWMGWWRGSIAVDQLIMCMDWCMHSKQLSMHFARFYYYDIIAIGVCFHIADGKSRSEYSKHKSYSAEVRLHALCWWYITYGI